MNLVERQLDKYPDLLTVDETKTILCIGRNKAYELINTKAIKSIKVGRRYLVPKEYLKEYIESSLKD